MFKTQLPDPSFWGKVTALGMGVFVTIACVAQSIDPLEIVRRAAISSIATGVSCAVALYCLTYVFQSAR